MRLHDVVKMREVDLQGFVLNLARDTGWLRTHSRPAQSRRGRWSTPIQGDPGFYDLVLVRAPDFLVAELKGYDSHGRLGQLEPEQWEWLAQAQWSGIQAYLWTPEDWLSGAIAEVLKPR